LTADRPAEALLRSLGITEPGQIDLEAIAWSVGAKVREEELESCEARIIGFRDRAVITVRKTGDPRRRRFSIGHELGHWAHHRGQSSVCRTSEIGNPSAASQREKQADRYAADLLMPRYLFIDSLSDLKRADFEGVDVLAATYGTSRIATVLRMVDLCKWPIILVWHTKTGRKYFSRSPTVPTHWFPRDELDPSSPSFGVLFDALDRTRAQSVSASLWFDRRDANRFRVVEQSVKSHGGEMLTILTLVDPEMLAIDQR
jgi:Zn-dependent peptidase ImmA (M78 family)